MARGAQSDSDPPPYNTSDSAGRMNSKKHASHWSDWPKKSSLAWLGAFKCSIVIVYRGVEQYD